MNILKKFLRKEMATLKYKFKDERLSFIDIS